MDTFNIFIDEFSSFLYLLNNIRQSTYICGDFNIDLLQIHSNNHYHSYFESILSNVFFPTITLPTRLSDASNFTCNTLIDNILTNTIIDLNITQSGILNNDISDHKMIFTYIENCNYKIKNDQFIEVEKNDQVSYEKFIEELKSLNIYEQLSQRNHSSIHETYDTFMYLISYAKELHLPNKLVKFDRIKHRKSNWITNGILKSIIIQFFIRT